MPQAALRSITPPLPRALPKAARAKVETAIEAHLSAVTALTMFLDGVDGDTDLEATGDDEPSLGSRGGTWDADHSDQLLWGSASTDDDREGGDVQDEPHDKVEEGNDEPWLAHTNDTDQEQARRHLGYLQIGGTWVSGAEDLEAEHDGREPEHCL